MKKERLIEAIVAFVFGLAVLLTAIFTDAGVAIIVLGALLTAVGVGCFVWALVDKYTKAKVVSEPAKVEVETKPTAKPASTAKKSASKAATAKKSVSKAE